MELSDVINVPLLLHPYNWVVVVLILAVAVLVLTEISAPLSQIGGLTQTL
jgi:membrane-bound ClpP family serine protease